MVRKSFMCLLALGLSTLLMTAGVTAQAQSTPDSNLGLEELVKRAKAEGAVNSLGIPDDWANWGETWRDLGTEYGLKHMDTDMSSAEELAKFENEKTNATGDVGDVGIAFGPLAVEKGLVIPYKTSYWDDIPAWAKDKDGYWMLGYTGTMAIITDKTKVKKSPKSWQDLKDGDFVISIGDPQAANQAQFAVLAAAYAFGGDEKNLQPGLDFFSELAQNKRLSKLDISVANLEKGEIEVAILWDFNALGYAHKIDRNRFEITIPEEDSIISGYSTVINKYAKHPYAAMLLREHSLSDRGQSNFARGFARPIRENAKLDDTAKASLLSAELYKNAHPVKDNQAWVETSKELPQMWQEEVLVHLQ